VLEFNFRYVGTERYVRLRSRCCMGREVNVLLFGKEKKVPRSHSHTYSHPYHMYYRYYRYCGGQSFGAHVDESVEYVLCRCSRRLLACRAPLQLLLLTVTATVPRGAVCARVVSMVLLLLLWTQNGNHHNTAVASPRTPATATALPQSKQTGLTTTPFNPHCHSTCIARSL
jgi:hypothetical protein